MRECYPAMANKGRVKRKTKSQQRADRIAKEKKQKNEGITFVVAVIVLLHERLSHVRNLRDLERAQSQLCRCLCADASAPLKFANRENGSSTENKREEGFVVVVRDWVDTTHCVLPCYSLGG